MSERSIIILTFCVFELQINNIALKKFDGRILRLKVLEILDLSNNLISTLPESLLPLSKLKQLNLSKNSIRVLPESFIKSARVSNLDLSHNQVRSVALSACGKFARFKPFFYLRSCFTFQSVFQECPAFRR